MEGCEQSGSREASSAIAMVVLHAACLHSMNKDSLQTCCGPSTVLNSRRTHRPALCPHRAFSPEDPGERRAPPVALHAAKKSLN